MSGHTYSFSTYDIRLVLHFAVWVTGSQDLYVRGVLCFVALHCIPATVCGDAREAEGQRTRALKVSEYASLHYIGTRFEMKQCGYHNRRRAERSEEGEWVM